MLSFLVVYGTILSVIRLCTDNKLKTEKVVPKK